MLRDRVGLLFYVLATLASFISAVHAEQGVCHTKSFYDVDVFHYFTQHGQHDSLSHLNGAQLMTGTDMDLPAFEIRGVGVTLADEEVSQTLSKIACSSHEITLYGSVLFVTNEPGGTLLSLSYAFDDNSVHTFMGLHINRSTNEIVIFYENMTHLRFETFPYVFQKGRWTKLSVTLTGNLMVLHADCEEVARRKIPLPNYCFGAEMININVGTGIEATELSSTGYSGSVQSVGAWFGRNGLGKQCHGTPDAAQCAMCGHHVKAMHHVNLLKEEIKLLEMKLASLEEEEKEDCAPSEERIYDSSCFHTNCLIEGITVLDDDYVYDSSGQICYCRNGAPKCVSESEIRYLPTISTEPSPLVEENNAPPPSGCTDGPVMIPGGETEYSIEFKSNKNIKQCLAHTCITIPFPKISKKEKNCAEYNNVNCLALTGEDIDFAQCCGACSPCSFNTCPTGMNCTVVGSMDYECVCPEGLELSSNRSSGTSCVDRDECSLGKQPGGHNCPSNSDCINTDGSFYCDCYSGFYLDNSDSVPQCIDIDECLQDLCPENAHCLNTEPGYSCSCNENYWEKDGACLPICEEPCEHGGFCSAPNTCSCPPGFEGLRCESDINECTTSEKNLCPGDGLVCVNLHGGYFCRCGPGFHYNADKGECQDVAECELYGCAGNARCVDTFGSFECICEDSTRLCSGDCRSSQGVIKHGHSVVSVKSLCDNCTCKDGEQVCSPLECDCNDPYVSDECCPHCKDTDVCVLDDVLLSVGAKYVSPHDRCLVYECQKSNGANATAVTVETAIQCPDLGDCPTNKRYVPEGACCPICAPSWCSGDQCIPTTPSECASVICPPLSCVSEEKITIPGTCCPVCEERLIEETLYCLTS